MFQLKLKKQKNIFKKIVSKMIHYCSLVDQLGFNTFLPIKIYLLTINADLSDRDIILSQKMTKNLFISLFILAILQCSVSQSVTCPDGTYPTTPLRDADHGKCTKCHDACKTCTDYNICTTYKDNIKGYDPNTKRPVCADYLLSRNWQYNPQTEKCSQCIQGCRWCVIDYDFCIECRAGYELDVKNKKCTRVSLGLSATILGLSVLVVVLAITTCIFAFKI